MSVAKIFGADGVTGMNVDATSKAARATLYDPFGFEIIAKPSVGSFLAGFLWRDTGVGTDGMLFSLFNPLTSTAVVRVRHWHINLMYDGTSSATGSNYYTKRTAFVAPTGGTQITPTKKRSADSASGVDLRQITTGGSTALTQGNMTQVSEEFLRWNLGLAPSARVIYIEVNRQSTFRRLTGALELGPGEGIGMFKGANSTAGQGACGYIEWDETAQGT